MLQLHCRCVSKVCTCIVKECRIKCTDVFVSASEDNKSSLFTADTVVTVMLLFVISAASMVPVSMQWISGSLHLYMRLHPRTASKFALCFCHMEPTQHW